MSSEQDSFRVASGIPSRRQMRESMNKKSRVSSVLGTDEEDTAASNSPGELLQFSRISQRRQQAYAKNLERNKNSYLEVVINFVRKGNTWKYILGFLLLVILVVGISLGALFLKRSSVTQSTQSQVGFVAEGRLGATVTIKLTSGISKFDLGKHLLIEGKGPKVDIGSPVIVRLSNFDAKGRASAKTPGGVLLVGKLSSQLVGQTLLEGLKDVREGSRLAFIYRKAGPDTTVEYELAIADVMSTMPQGKIMPKPQNAPVWIKTPTGPAQIIDLQPKPKTESWSALVVESDGEQVRSDDTVIGQYAIFNATDGKVIESTWEAGDGPVRIPLRTTMSAIASELVDSKVGSRLIIRVPASGADGKNPVVVVVDILARMKKGM
ncbi:hypothetical protein KRX54_04220 [Actinomycetaceae bacterium TAE3-ERU4]|nr:hypothetical protein [Actinomycetaceae bacterium TAE3-ERU4]